MTRPANRDRIVELMKERATCTAKSAEAQWRALTAEINKLQREDDRRAKSKGSAR